MNEVPRGNGFDMTSETIMDEEVELIDYTSSADNYLNGVGTELPEAVDSIETDELVNDFVKDLQSRLRMIGLQNPERIDEEALKVFVGGGYQDADSVEDLYFEVWDYERQELGRFSRVRIEYLLEFAETIEPGKLQKEQDDRAKISLIKLGINADELLDVGSGGQKRSVRRLAWLLTKEPFLSDFAMGMEISALRGEGAKLETTALRVREILREARKNQESMHNECMNSIDKASNHGEIRRLGYIVALAESVYEGILGAPKAYGSLLEAQE